MVVDLRYVSEDLETAYYQALDAAEELADRLAFVTFSPADVEMVSVTYPVASPGELFEIALPIPRLPRTSVDVTVEDIAQFDQPRPARGARALRLLRTGLSSVSSYHALAQLWAGTEVLAEERAELEGMFLEHTCAKCGETRKGPLRTQPYIEANFATALSVDNKADTAAEVAKETRRVRGKVIHGGRLQDRLLRTEVNKTLSHLAMATMIGLSDALKAKSAILVTGLIGQPVLFAQLPAHPAMADVNAATRITAFDFKYVVAGSGARPLLPNAYGRHQDATILFAGVQAPMDAPNIVWPAISGPATAP